MERVVRTDSWAVVHDLLRLRDRKALHPNGRPPPWVKASLDQCPWVVVRRGPIRHGIIPVGVRGRTRSQRFAGWVVLSEVTERYSPPDLIASLDAINLPRRALAPALAALRRVASPLQRRFTRWGPGGGVGFEIATGEPVITASSDLDLVLWPDRRLEPDEAFELQGALYQAAAPVRMDVLLETPAGGVALADLAARPVRVLVRTPQGACLCADPWSLRPEPLMSTVP